MGSFFRIYHDIRSFQFIIDGDFGLKRSVSITDVHGRITEWEGFLKDLHGSWDQFWKGKLAKRDLPILSLGQWNVE